MLGFQECCDALYYSQAGQICRAGGWEVCWHGYRALGSILLNAIMPFPPLSHALLLLFSLFFIAFDLQLGSSRTHAIWHIRMSVRPDKSSVLFIKKYLLKALGAFLLLEIMFLGLASVNLSDVPAGVFAAIAILGFYRKNALLFALAAGAGVLIRAAYLYPMMTLAVYFILESLYKKRLVKAAIVSLFFFCIAPQYWMTYQHIGKFSFLDPSQVEIFKNSHFTSNSAGYDTIISPVSGYSWQSGAALGSASAFEQHQWAELYKLLVSRMDFYFASGVPLGKVYLYSASERIFSPIVLILHLGVFTFSFLYLKAKGNAWRIWTPLSIILAQSLLIKPEQRFIFVIQMFLVMFAYLYFMRVIEKQTA